MNVKRYLKRIGMTTMPAISKEFLFQLHEHHLRHVAFENLDVHYGVPIVLDPNLLYTKIVEQGRGGFCYELNGLFGHLLKAIGFEAKLISCRVYLEEGTYSPEYDHMAVIVRLGKASYLVDVGFGSFIQNPLPLVYDIEVKDPNGIFIFREGISNDQLQLCRLKEGVRIPEYIFTTHERQLSEFTVRCDFHQNDPKSHMAKKKMISQATRDGRMTLTESELIITKNGVKSKSNSSSATFERLVKQHFNIELKLP